MESLANIVMPWTYLFRNKKTEQEGGSDGNSIVGLVVSIIGVIIGVYAGYLCWKCNSKEDLGLKVIYTFLSFFNAIPYLIYYLIIRVIIGAPCKCCGGAM
jgi:ABC-type dipeptide/oligopeptide/nickel transport system permease subunit